VLKGFDSGRVRLWDGGMGAALIAGGLAQGQAPESWSLDRPDVIQDLHRRYYAAGSDVVLTNTFGANGARLRHAGCSYSVEETCLAGARLARDVRPEGRFVAGDVGPTGLMLPPVGDADERELEDLFCEQADALARGGVDLLHIETMSDLREARAALRGARRACGLPVIASLTVRRTPRGAFTIMGDEAGASLAALLDEGADGVGLNCTLSSMEMAAVACDLGDRVNGFLVVQPNAGEPRIADGSVRYPEGPEFFCEALEPLLKAGIGGVGGCCGTTPGHIAGLARRLGREGGP